MRPTETTDSSYWQRLDALLSEALLLPPEQREGWLLRLSPEDRALEPVLRSMLNRAEAETDSFMRSPVPPIGLAAVEETTALERPGAFVGPYRLIRELGTGGMGTVWLAERADGALSRQVAIKLPRSGWALGVAERLQQERDALAALEHPNIARLYDAGVTRNGRPYIAMEYVDGLPIDEYVVRHALSLEQRLALFLQIARAVSYAHARLIVHRDLKPSNILVSNTGEVRLLDFGAAKLLRDDSPRESALTMQLGRALSPDYASPEQIRGNRITVGTDVYSLGIVLYELLTGQRPYHLPRESFAELEEAITVAEIPLPSSRVKGNPRLVRALQGDLDTILLKSVKHDPTERYGSVEAFADDISRYLAGEPVLAQADSTVYRMVKFVRRHSVAVAAAVAVVLSVGVGAGVALWQARVASVEAARANRVKQFIASIFTQAVPRTGVGGVVTASDLLVAASDRVERELSGEPAVATELGVIIAESLESLGEPAKGEPLLRMTVSRAERTFGRGHPTTLHAKVLLIHALAMHDVEGALALAKEVGSEALNGLPGTAERAYDALQMQSFVLAKLNRSEESYDTLRRAIAIAEKHLGPLNENTVWGLGLLGNTYGRFGDRKQQLAAATEAFQRGERAFGNQRPHGALLAVERWYAEALGANGRPGEAVPILRRVVSDQERLDAGVTLRVRHAKVQLARALLGTGRIEEGLPLMREVVALERQQNPNESDDRRAFGDLLAAALTLAYQTDEALVEDERVDAIVARLGPEPPRIAIGRRIRRARNLALRGDSRRAEDGANEAAQLAGPQQPELQAEALLVAGLNARLQSRLPRALEVLQHLANGDQFESYPLALQSFIAAELGTVLLETGDLAGAESQLTRCRERFAGAQIEPSVRVSTCLVGSARLALQAGRAAEAEQLLVPLEQSWKEVNPGSPFHGETLYWLSRARAAKGETAAAQRDAKVAESLLAQSKLPALRR